MTTVLKINSSINSGNGLSSQLADEFVATLLNEHGKHNVIARDLASDPIPHLDTERFGAFIAKPESRTTQQRAVVDFSDRLIDELRRADVIVLGLPLYNFGVPSMLKSYFDHIARAGVTFRYTETGPVGLLTNKKAYVFATRGGRSAGTPLDTQTVYVRDFLRFLGIEDVEFVYAEGLAMGEQPKLESIAHARDAIAKLVPANRNEMAVAA